MLDFLYLPSLQSATLYHEDGMFNADSALNVFRRILHLRQESSDLSTTRAATLLSGSSIKLKKRMFPQSEEDTLRASLAGLSSETGAQLVVDPELALMRLGWGATYDFSCGDTS